LADSVLNGFVVVRDPKAEVVSDSACETSHRAKPTQKLFKLSANRSRTQMHRQQSRRACERLTRLWIWFAAVVAPTRSWAARSGRWRIVYCC
jgi:hypothetical protein